MKYSVIFLFIMFLFGSCKSNIDVPDQNDNKNDRAIGGDFVYHAIYVTILDELLQDRLSPESPVYLGEEFIKGIKLFRMIDGRKVEADLGYFYDYQSGVWRLSHLPAHILTTDELVEMQMIQSPNRKYIDKDGETWYIPQNPYGYYFIRGISPTLFEIEDGREVGYTYIQYPDGSEDVIKVRVYENEANTISVYDKIWINGEVVRETKIIGALHTDFYNPKYYPWLEPVFDDNGKQIGEMPKLNSPVVVITK